VSRVSVAAVADAHLERAVVFAEHLPGDELSLFQLFLVRASGDTVSPGCLIVVWAGHEISWYPAAVCVYQHRLEVCWTQRTPDLSLLGMSWFRFAARLTRFRENNHTLVDRSGLVQGFNRAQSVRMCRTEHPALVGLEFGEFRD
jgi:hypothetical protein